MQFTGHSWSPVFGRSTENSPSNSILISTLGLDTVTSALNTESLDPLTRWFWKPKVTELNSIKIVDEPNPGEGALVRVGAATTNEQLREWCVENKKLTLPLNVIMR